MSRMAIIQVKCDLCGSKSDEYEGDIVNVVLTIDSAKPVEVDVCDDCSSQESLVVLLENARTVIVPKAPKPPKKVEGVVTLTNDDTSQRTIPCDYPGCTFVGKSLQSLGTHKARTHKKVGPQKKVAKKS